MLNASWFEDVMIIRPAREAFAGLDAVERSRACVVWMGVLRVRAVAAERAVITAALQAFEFQPLRAALLKGLVHVALNGRASGVTDAHPSPHDRQSLRG
jgi:hypothetical protein